MLQWMQISDIKDINLHWIRKYTRGKGWKQGLFKAIAVETIYSIWNQRNILEGKGGNKASSKPLLLKRYISYGIKGTELFLKKILTL